MVTTRHLTVDEFGATAREGIWELVDGEPIEMLATGGESGWTSGILFAELLNHVRPRALGWVFPRETGFILFPDQETVRSPDAAFVAGDRLERPPQGFIPLAPDLAVEVLSPSDRMAEALGKVGMYLDAGVRLVWLVDPTTRTVTVYRPNAAPETLGGGDHLVGGDVLPGFALPVAEMFG
jgi:Uma2 family endonuclease